MGLMESLRIFWDSKTGTCLKLIYCNITDLIDYSYASQVYKT